MVRGDKERDALLFFEQLSDLARSLNRDDERISCERAGE